MKFEITLPNLILIIGSLIVLYFAYQWYSVEMQEEKPSLEPVVTLAATLLTVISYFLSIKSQTAKSSNTTNKNNIPTSSNENSIVQHHSGTGDNIGGNKYVK